MQLDIVVLIIVLLSILISMTLHEAMHAFASYWLGDDTAKLEGRLTVNPIAHIDPLTTVILPLMLVALGAPPFGAAKPVPFNPYRLRFGEYGAAIVGVAGPATNLILAIISGLSLRFFGESMDMLAFQVFGWFTLVNLSFFIFNMIPFPPLDGSRLLYAFAPDSLRNIMERIESMGFAAIILFFVLFYTILSDPFSRVLSGAFNLLTGSQLGA